jgi:hypothetical protein
MPAYSIDTDLETLANDIIQECRPVLGHVKIAYMFRPEAPVSDEQVRAGMCCRVDDRNRTVHGYDFIIEISKDVWDESTPDYKRALMDHELGHVGIRMDEDGDVVYDEKMNRPKTYIKRHDIEEFEDVLERHGAYHKGLREFLAAFGRNKAKAKKANTTQEGNLVPDAED